MKEFDSMHTIDSGKTLKQELNQIIDKLILSKNSFYRYFVLYQERVGGVVRNLMSWQLYGTNQIDELLNLIGENGVSFYKVTIVNMKTEIVKLNAKEVATEKVYGMNESGRKELLGMLLVESLLTRKIRQGTTRLDRTKWQPISKEDIDAYEKAIRNSRRQSSCSGAFHHDVCSLIERLTNEENYAYQFYVVTITGEPPEGVMGGTTYWNINGYTSEDLHRLMFGKNDHLFMVSKEGIKQVSR